MNTTRQLALSDTHGHVAVLGKTGAGKTWTLRTLIEDAYDEEMRICILDPKGDHWGIKLAVDGKTFSGLDFVHLASAEHNNTGGQFDCAIDERMGAGIGELVAKENFCSIIDLGGWPVGERTRFAVDFFSALYRHNRSHMLFVVDEVHNFAPQGRVLDPDSGKMLHWMNRISSEGRGRGIRLFFASQRPQKVHKDTLTCADTLIAKRVLHPLDRDAVKEWVDGQGDAKKSKMVLDSLAALDKTEAWVWNPEADLLQRMGVRAIRTYDSMRTPEPGQHVAIPRVDASKVLDVVRALREVCANESDLEEGAAPNTEEVETLRRENAELRTAMEEMRARQADTLKVLESLHNRFISSGTAVAEAIRRATQDTPDDFVVGDSADEPGRYTGPPFGLKEVSPGAMVPVMPAMKAVFHGDGESNEKPNGKIETVSSAGFYDLRGPAGKLPVLGAINRDGRVRAVLADDVTKYTIHQFIRETVSAGANLHTDESKTYLGLDGYNHSRVNHAMGEYVNGDVHTNTCESFWAMLKRGHYGIFHQMSQKHLHRYLNEFAARWNMTEMSGAQRLDSMLEATPGLRLTYERLIA